MVSWVKRPIWLEFLINGYLTQFSPEDRPRPTIHDRPRPTHGHKCTNYRMCQNTMMVIYIKHLRNIWSSFFENVKQHWG